MSTIDRKIIEEIKRYNSINKYIVEQDLPPLPGEELPAPGGDAPVGGDAPIGGGTPPPAGDVPVGGGEPTPVDTNTDPDVEKINPEGESEDSMDEESDSEELDITDLVTAQKDMSQKQEDYFDKLFSHLDSLESKLSEMDQLMDKVNSLEATIEKSRPKTPQEKLELRSLDSGPYNQKLSDFFIDKEQDMEKSGKNEYVLTSDEVENFTPSEIKGSFNPEMKKNFGF
jgi:hypothetical protein